MESQFDPERSMSTHLVGGNTATPRGVEGISSPAMAMLTEDVRRVVLDNGANQFPQFLPLVCTRKPHADDSVPSHSQFDDPRKEECGRFFAEVTWTAVAQPCAVIRWS